MSSHHFVKEGQEPALLIMDALGLPLIEPLLEWAPQVMVFENALDQVLDWGIKIDVVIAKPDSGEILARKLESQAPVKFLSDNAGEDVDLALYFLISTRQKAVSIVTANADALFDKLDTFLPQLGITLLTDTVKWSGIASGSYKKWLPAASRLLVHGYAMPELPDGLKRSDGAYEVLRDGFVTMAPGTPFWVGEVIGN
ncbi:hypothetical protein KK083_30230 [Fulvivirgaceae bacterium PWU4]|uniref:Thiamine pyrophosphokinase n=1 Tax=Chryseosolibacter histidini TaxID=2782349 RepID=A0AAP2DRL2_9BACT|nr:hypothetical protein [Chryseosolibacter histidini]MBT1701208.1 hypothetical protein [Chryseosolibacter histidini]